MMMIIMMSNDDNDDMNPGPDDKAKKSILAGNKVDILARSILYY
jgi:hypothetical protein